MSAAIRKACHSPLFNILLIDDDPQEKRVVERIIAVLTDAPICVDQVARCSEGVRLLNTHDYDLVLLDNRLSAEISAEFSAPFIRSTGSRAIVAIISSDIDVDYLRDPSVLNVDEIVDKADMIAFLRHQLSGAIRTDLYPVKRHSRRVAAQGR